MPEALVWAGLAVAAAVVAGFLFWVSARLVHVEASALFGRAMLSALLCGIVSAAVVAMVLIITDWAGGKEMSLYTQSLTALLAMVFCLVILRTGFASTFRQAFGVWCCALGMAAVLAVALIPLLPILNGLLAAHGVADLPAPC
jgi:hypothetical protein